MWTPCRSVHAQALVWRAASSRGYENMAAEKTRVALFVLFTLLLIAAVLVHDSLTTPSSRPSAAQSALEQYLLSVLHDPRHRLRLRRCVWPTNVASS